ncbi:MAG: hypothetical protein K9K64_03210 [Desulfohalobiaceae bacterium]|nr:hypothetical protein [Desulfohalobiaceae bacterium]
MKLEKNFIDLCDLAMTADAAAALFGITAACDTTSGIPSQVVQSRSEKVAVFHRKYGCFNEQEYAAGESLMLPQRIIAEMQKIFPEDTIYTCDAGENKKISCRRFWGNEKTFIDTNRQPGIRMFI